MKSEFCGLLAGDLACKIRTMIFLLLAREAKDDCNNWICAFCMCLRLQRLFDVVTRAIVSVYWRWCWFDDTASPHLNKWEGFAHVANDSLERRNFLENVTDCLQTNLTSSSERLHPVSHVPSCSPPASCRPRCQQDRTLERVDGNQTMNESATIAKNGISDGSLAEKF